ncbi:alpha/beta hydrolase [Thalassotalea fusca]
MRTITKLTALFFTLSAFSVSASTIDCINLNHDVSRIESLADNGQYRNFPKDKDTPTFDYQSSQSYEEYLNFARKKVNAENPKAKLKCPISTGVTKAQNKAPAELTVADLVTPFELKVPNSNRAILLVHGLTDSPYHFHDLASFFYDQGLTVRTLLLPGHSTAAEALVDVSYKEWQQATHYAIEKTLEDFEQVYLGGFSTGGALILDNLLSTTRDLAKVNGVILWAPASQAKSTVAWAAQYVDWLPFLDYTHKGADIDFAKYESFPLNAGAQVHELMIRLNDKVNRTSTIPDVPVLTITTEHDSTIETSATIKLLRRWHQAQNRTTKHRDAIFYFGRLASLSTLPDSFRRIQPTCRDAEYCAKILNVAHTAVLNAPSNPHYGWRGHYRNCEAVFGSEHYKICKTTNEPVLGETTSENMESHPYLQRLTFNPGFDQMTKVLTNFIRKPL